MGYFLDNIDSIKKASRPRDENFNCAIRKVKLEKKVIEIW